MGVWVGSGWLLTTHIYINNTALDEKEPSFLRKGGYMIVATFNMGSTIQKISQGTLYTAPSDGLFRLTANLISADKASSLSSVRLNLTYTNDIGLVTELPFLTLEPGITEISASVMFKALVKTPILYDTTIANNLPRLYFLYIVLEDITNIGG